MLNLESKVTKEYNNIRRSLTPKNRRTNRITLGTFTDGKSYGMKPKADNIDLLGVTEEEIDAQIENLFKHPPIEFVARKSSKLDDAIQRSIDENQITIPVHHIEDNLYLIGSKRLNCSLQNDSVLVTVGESNKKFKDYVLKNDRSFKRDLVIDMFKSGESLETVIENIMNGKSNQNDVNFSHLEARSYSPISTRYGSSAVGYKRGGTYGGKESLSDPRFSSKLNISNITSSKYSSNGIKTKYASKY